MGAIETLIDNIDAMILGFVQGSFGALTDSIHILWQLMFIVFIAVYGYKVMISGRFSASDMIVHCVKIIIILVVATQWDSFFTLVYNIVTDLPNDIAGQILQGSTNTLGSSAQPTDLMSANSGLSDFFDRGMKIVEKIMEGAAMFDISTYAYAGCVFAGTVGFTGYAGMLIILSKIAVALLLAVGPIFILLLTFSNSRGLFEGWLRTLLNYSVIPIFVYTLLAFLLSLAQRPLENLEQHSGVTQSLLDGVAPYALVTFISVLLLMQVMNMAASVTGGLSLSTMDGPSWGAGQIQKKGLWGWNRTAGLRKKSGAAIKTRAVKSYAYLKNALKKNKEAQ